MPRDAQAETIRALEISAERVWLCALLDPNAAEDGDEGLGWVRDQVGRVRKMLRRRRPALLALARALAQVRLLDRRECARIVRAAGTRVRLRPVFSPIVGLGERSDCDSVRIALAERNSAYVRGRSA